MVEIDKALFGSEHVPIIAGPCSLESREQFFRIASKLKDKKVPFLRGGLYKLRTKKDSFQGLGKEGYGIAKEVSEELKMPFVTEVTDPRQVEELSEITRIFQVGTRNMYNYELLKELGSQSLPVLLKRAFSATYSEFLNAAEYITSLGNSKVLLCERGIRTFVNETRNTFDINIIPFLKQNSHLPVLADPSHGTGVSSYVKPIALASLAAGADGLLIEVHDEPHNALSDGQQALTPEEFEELLVTGNGILKALGRSFYERS